MDISHALSRELAVGTGLLPENTLWWLNSRDGQVYAIYVEPKVRKVTLQDDLDNPRSVLRYHCRALVFLCSPCKAPWVVAVTKRPTKSDRHHLPRAAFKHL